jgi:serine/threonine protein phosphatase PrpC
LPLSEEASYLVCTGGLADPVPSGVLDEVMRRARGWPAVFELWKAAIEVGGPDNITRALVRLGTQNQGRLGAEAAPLSRLAGEEYRRYGRSSRDAR